MLLIFYGWIIGGANWIAGMKLFFHTFEEAALSVSVDWSHPSPLGPPFLLAFANAIVTIPTRKS